MSAGCFFIVTGIWRGSRVPNPLKFNDLRHRIFFVDTVIRVCYNAAMKKKATNKPRARVDWNTGERIHQPKKGKGSYNRKKSKKSN